ncbi:AraC family transcriptional regulator [Paenibacillus ferrarius]|uniref:helix-turn-helix transcriptional regulator n=1 Tax=Paenibacillus ferrarius TaxID=1469647 RepID=UPI003D2A6436
MKFLENVLSDKPFIWAHRNITMDESGFTSFHAHPGLEFLYVEQGAGHILIDKRIMPIKAETLYIFQPYQLHRVHAAASETQPYIRNVLVVDPYVFEPYLAPFPDLRSYFGKLWKEDLPSQAFDVGEMKSLYHLFHEEFKGEADARSIENVAVTLLCLIRFARNASPESKDAAWHKPVLRKTGLAEQAMTWLESHFQEDFHLPDLAAQLHVSPFYLSRIFKQDTGNTIQEYVMARRLREACILLQNTDYSMTYIAERVGFTSSSYFIHTFKKHVGITPLQYRKQGRHM